jgi:hypothetical protein
MANSCLHITDFEIQKMPQMHRKQKFTALPPLTELVQEDVAFQSMRA